MLAFSVSFVVFVHMFTLQGFPHFIIDVRSENSMLFLKQEFALAHTICLFVIHASLLLLDNESDA